MEIVLILLISRMFICIFPLLSITIILYVLFGNTSHINDRFCLLGWLQPLGYSPDPLHPYYSLAVARVCIISYTWKIYWFKLTPSILAKELELSCAVFWFILDCILIFPSLNSILHRSFLFFGLCWKTVGYVCLSAIWPLIDI